MDIVERLRSEFVQYINTVCTKFNCECDYSVSLAGDGIDVYLLVKGPSRLECYEVLCNVFEKYCKNSLLRYSPKVESEKDFEANILHHRGRVRFIVTPNYSVMPEIK